METPTIAQMAEAFCKDRLIVVNQYKAQAEELEAKANSIRNLVQDLENMIAEAQLTVDKFKAMKEE